jgi:hypothetical protein
VRPISSSPTSTEKPPVIWLASKDTPIQDKSRRNFESSARSDSGMGSFQHCSARPRWNSGLISVT